MYTHTHVVQLDSQLPDTPQSIGPCLASQQQVFLARHQKHWQALETVLEVVLVQHNLVEPDLRVSAVLGSELVEESCPLRSLG